MGWLPQSNFSHNDVTFHLPDPSSVKNLSIFPPTLKISSCHIPSSEPHNITPHLGDIPSLSASLSFCLVCLSVCPRCGLVRTVFYHPTLAAAVHVRMSAKSFAGWRRRVNSVSTLKPVSFVTSPPSAPPLSVIQIPIMYGRRGQPYRGSPQPIFC